MVCSCALITFLVLTSAIVDDEIARMLSLFVHLSIDQLLKFCTVLSFSPLFIIPGSIITILGGLCAQMYMKAQLCVKREMSNAKAPVLGHFGAAMTGLSMYNEFFKIRMH